MSYILDALRRADDERQRHGPRTPELAPGLAAPTTLHHARRRPSSSNTIAAAVVIVVALASTGAWLWTDHDRSPTDSPGNNGATATVPPGDRPVVASITVPRVQIKQPDEPTTTIPVPPPPTLDEPTVDNNAGAAMTAVALPTPVNRPAPAEAEAEPRTGPALRGAVGGTPGTDSGDLPTAWRDLPLSQRKNLPHPRLDVHVYDTDPRRRFVMIALQKYREGDALPDSSELERIHADGIILVFRGQRYSLPRR